MNRQGKLEPFGVVAFISGIILLIAYAVLTFKNESTQGRWFTGVTGAILILAAIADWIDLFEKIFGKRDNNENSSKIEQEVEKGTAIGQVKNGHIEIHQEFKDKDNEPV